MRQRHGVWAIVFVLGGLAVLAPSAARAHDIHRVGDLTLTIGWAEEPAYVGILNAVEVSIAVRDGEPPHGLDAALVVEVLFGTQSISLALDPADHPARFLAPVMPTRAGLYTFVISGRINDDLVTITSQCGSATFDCVSDPAELQFPERDPSIGELAALLEGGLSAVPAGVDAADPSPWPLGATITAALSLVVALGALVVAVARPRRGGRPRAE